MKKDQLLAEKDKVIAISREEVSVDGKAGAAEQKDDFESLFDDRELQAALEQPAPSAVTVDALPFAAAAASNSVLGTKSRVKFTLRFRNFQSEHLRQKFKEATKLLMYVLNNQVFQTAFLDDGFKLEEHDHGDDANKVILGKILSGKSIYEDDEDKEIDIDVTLYSRWWSKVIGYTKAGTPRTWINRKYLNRMELPELAGHILHEYCHNLGYKHSAVGGNSVPYAVGRLLSKHAWQLLDTFEAAADEPIAAHAAGAGAGFPTLPPSGTHARTRQTARPDVFAGRRRDADNTVNDAADVVPQLG